MTSPIFTHRTTLPLALGAAFLLALQAIPTLHAADVTWSSAGSSTAGGNGNWTGGSTWWNGSSAVTWTSGDNATFTAAGNTTVNSSVTVGNITFSSSAANISILDGAGDITLNSGITATNTANTAARTFTISESIALGANQTWTVNAGGSTGTANLAVSGNRSGTGSLIKAGNGTLTLTGTTNRTTTGNLTINGGTVSATQTSIFLNTTVNTGGTLSLSGNIQPSDANSINITVNGGAVTGGSKYYLGAIVLNNGTMSQTGQYIRANGWTMNGNNTISGAGTIILENNPTNSGLFNVQSGTTTISTAINTGQNGFSGNFTKNGSGTLVLSGANTWGNGATKAILNAGTLVLNHNTALGNNTFTINGGTLDNTSGSAKTLTNNNTQSWNGDFTFLGTNGSLNTGTGAVTMNASRTVTVSNGTFTVGGAIGGATFGLTKAGAGTMILSGNNTYSGTTTISAGTMEIAAAGRLGAGSYAQNISNSEALIYSGTSDQTLSGVISGTGNLTQNASSTLTLTNTNTYNGSTTINAGTLQIDGNIANSGLVINSGGTISPGTTAAADSFGTSSITINGGGYNWTLNTANGSAGSGWDQITSTGALTSSGLLTIYAYGTPGDWDNAGNYSWDIISANSVTGFSSGNFAIDFSNFGILGGNRTGVWTFSNPSSGIIRLTYGAVSDPSWAGGTGNWTTGFSSNITNGNAIYFTGADGGTATNNIPSGTLSSLASINFQGGAGAYTLVANSGSAGNGSALTVTSGITNLSSSTQTINMDLGFSTTQTITATGGDIAIGGVISGLGGLTKVGTYTLTLTGNNTYTGATTISAGTLEIGAAGRLNSGSYSNTISNDGTLIYSGTNNQTLSGAISGIGVLTQNGTGTLTVTAYDVTQGSTVINAGTLQLDNSSGSLAWSGGTIAINNGSTLEFTGTAQTIFQGTADNVTFDSGGGGSMLLTKNPIWRSTEIITTGGAKNSISGTYFNGEGLAYDVIYNTAVGTDAGGIALEVSSSHSDIGLIKNGLGTLALTNATNSLSSRGITINSGTLEIAGAGRLGSGNYTYGITNNGTFSYNSTATQTISGNFSGSGAIIKNGSGTLTTTGATSSGAITINSGSLVLQAAVPVSSYLAASAININNGSTVTIQNGYIVSGKTFTFGSSGGGTMIIGSGNNVFESNFTITTTGGSQNTLSSGVMNCHSSSDNHTFNIADGTDDIDLLVSTSLQNQASFQKSGAGKLGLTANNTFTGNLTINNNSGTVEIGGSGRLGGGSYAGNISIGTNSFFTYNSTLAQTLSGVISGTGALIKDNSSSTLTISGNNTHSGSTTISAGTLVIGAAGRLGGGSYSNTITNNGTLIYSGTNAQTLSGVISGTGNLTQNASSTLTLSAANTYTGTTTINVGTIQIGAGGTTGSLSTSSAITNNGSLVFNRSNAVAQGTDFANGISGTGSLTQNGSGTLTLSSANTYSGGTTLNTGTLVIGNTAAAGNGTITQTNGSSLLKFDTTGTIANAMSIFNVSANKTVTLSGGITVNNAVFDVASGETLTISNTINGTGGVTKNGTGTLLLSGNNTYSAATVINAGTLNATSAGALGSNNTVQVNGGSLLVTADDAINGKNIELGGSGIGLQFSGNYSGAIGNLTLSANSIIDLGSGSVQILFQGLNSSNHTLSFYNWSGTTLWNGGNGTTDTDKVYFGPDLSDEALAKIYFYTGPGDSFLGSGFDLGLKATGFTPAMGHQIIPVPEPETYATGLLLLLGGGLWMWRKRKLEAGTRNAI